VLTLAALFAVVAVSFAADLNMGTWKLNEAKSQIAPGAVKNNLVVIAPVGDSVKITVDGVGADGKPSHNEWKGKFDGKDYSLMGVPTVDTRAYKPLDDHTMALTEKKDGKTIITGTQVISADGKTRTITVNEPGERQADEYHVRVRQAVASRLFKLLNGRGKSNLIRRSEVASTTEEPLGFLSPGTERFLAAPFSYFSRSGSQRRPRETVGP